MSKLLYRSVRYALIATLFLQVAFLSAQETRIAREILAEAGQFARLKEGQPLVPITGVSTRDMRVAEAVESAAFFAPDWGGINTLLREQPQFLAIDLPVAEIGLTTLWLRRADILTEEFMVTLASRPDEAYPFRPGAYYWGIVEGWPNSLVALAFSGEEVMGFVQLGEKNYTLGKLAGDPAATHILYATDDLKQSPGVNCFIDDSYEVGKGRPEPGGARYNENNCVRMYIEADHDLYVAKGGVQQTVDYLTGAFSQVAILYANENIDFTVNQIVVWDVADPYTGPTTSNFLSQFRSHLNGNFNGDLAHLVGTTGGGGIAYVDVLCYKLYGVGYSMIYSTYANVPTYSWTIEVLTHEIGHNLGSSHTHACVWNGNNTAIDGCGPTAGYSEGNCPVAPLPTNGGTIMSYCHLVGGVGINFNNGFGPQPGDRIRSEVYNASCLTPCTTIQHDAGVTAIAQPIPYPCNAITAPVVTLKNFGSATLTSVNIKYQVDAGTVSTYSWTGSLASNQTAEVTLPTISYAVGPHTFKAWTNLPNGQTDETPSNDLSTKAFEYIVGWCDCNECVAHILPNPLTHTGSGSSTATLALESGSKHPDFTITGLNAKLNGPSQSRFNEAVTVTYVDGNGQTVAYGTFYGAQQSSVNVLINGFVNSITITLSNALNNGYAGTLSVSFSPVDFCAPGCPDSDCDGICDDIDPCPNLDNALFGTPCDDGNPCTVNDVYNEDCGCAGTPVPNCCPNPTISQFTPNPLNHQGSGQTSSSVTLPAGQGDVRFTISNINARLGGAANKRFIDKVTVWYRTSSGGPEILYGVYRGDEDPSANVLITGVVYNVRIALEDAYDGNTGNEVISVSMSSVESCPVSGAMVAEDEGGFEVYPNPATDELMIRIPEGQGEWRVRFVNLLGATIASDVVGSGSLKRYSLRTLGIQGGQMITILAENTLGQRIVTPVVVVD